MRGGMGNMGDIMKKAQKMQEEFAKMQVELGQKDVEASSGGGAVTVKVNGNKQVLSIKIDRELISSGDVDMIQDLVTAAVNEGLNKAQEMMDEQSKKIAGSMGLNIPGMF
ncbi:MAG: YbaB/EbfC family nucleoid-associated protein [Spirochaetia bacterium]|nr:YbaB/EbfC family nucleoid-associated protein [Spirochaetia bacterium]